MPTLLGLNSGTSADGVDAAVVRFEGETPTLALKILAWVHRAYPLRLKKALESLYAQGRAPLDLLCALPYEIGDVFAMTALDALQAAGLSGNDIDVCGSHGQTIYHLAADAARDRALPVSTWQMGEASLIATRLGCPVASDFRAADIASGGQGAPLTPVLDDLLFRSAGKTRVRLNIGGIANLTWLPPVTQSGVPGLIAFDTGPGNTLIDSLIRRLTGGAEHCDRDGERALRGHVDEALLARMLADPYFTVAPPKSTGRELFSADWLEGYGVNDSDDSVATVTALTPASIVHALREHLPPVPPIDEVIVHGGGARNPAIMEGLRARLAPSIRIATVDEFGLAPETIEPLLFAVLAWRCLRREPTFLPGATGMRRPAVLGKLSWPAGLRES